AREDLAGQEVSAANSRHSRLSFCCSWWPHRLGLCYVVRLCLLDAFFWARRRSKLFSNCLESHVERRDDEDADQRGQYHAAEDWRADIAARQLRGADSDHQRQEAKNKSERCH